MKKTRLKALLLPGFNGSAEQPMLLALAERLEAEGIDAIRRAPAPGRPSVDLASETTWLLNELKPLGSNVCVVGRSFGGRLALRAAHVHSMLCLGLLANIVLNALLSAPSPFQRFALPIMHHQREALRSSKACSMGRPCSGVSTMHWSAAPVARWNPMRAWTTRVSFSTSSAFAGNTSGRSRKVLSVIAPSR